MASRALASFAARVHTSGMVDASSTEVRSGAGRRLYVHDESFRVLTGDPGAEPSEVATSLAGAKAMRVAEHHLDSAASVGVLDRQTARAAIESLAPALYGPITQLLRATVEFASPVRDRGPRSLLGPFEQVVSSCFDSGYWTFATTPLAADRMHADHAPLRGLYAEHRAGTGPSDLTMIRGPRLRATASVGPVSSRLAVESSLPLAAWTTLYLDALGSYGERLCALLRTSLYSRTEFAPDVIDGIRGTLDRLALFREPAET
jgi:hypothetical protein